MYAQRQVKNWHNYTDTLKERCALRVVTRKRVGFYNKLNGWFSFNFHMQLPQQVAQRITRLILLASQQNATKHDFLMLSDFEH